MAAKTLKNLYRSQAVTLELSQKRRENQCKIWNEKTESYVFRGFGNGIFAAENEIAQLSCLKGNLKANIENV